MADSRFTGIGEGIVGAFLIAVALVTPFFRCWRIRWGATDAEVHLSLPGDDLVPYPKWEWTHAITIRACAADVWPWIVQVGQGRGGFYSYQWLQNLVGCDIHNADRIIPGLQHLEVGDSVKLHTKTPGYPVAVVEPGRALVLHAVVDSQTESKFAVTGSRLDKYLNTNWVWFLEPLDEGTTRLISRARYDYYPSLWNRLVYGSCMVEPIGLVMSRKMLLGIKKRAEAVAKRHEE